MKMKKPKKNITLDDLAGMVAEGFNEARDSVNKRFDLVDKRLKNLEEGQEQIKLRLDNIAYRFELI